MSSESSKESFWKWFTSNQAQLEDFINDPNRDYAIYHEMTEELQKFIGSETAKWKAIIQKAGIEPM